MCPAVISVSAANRTLVGVAAVEINTSCLLSDLIFCVLSVFSERGESATDLKDQIAH